MASNLILTCAEAEAEMGRRRAAAKQAASRLVAARKGLRGTVAALIRRFGSGPLIDQCAAINRSGLFLRDYYIYTHQRSILPNVEPVVDYVLIGAFEGRNPNPLFDSDFYLRQTPGLFESGVNPLLHYITEGEAKGLLPNADFDPQMYREAHPELPEGMTALADFLARTAGSSAPPKGSYITRAWRGWMGQLLQYDGSLKRGRRRKLPRMQTIGFVPDSRQGSVRADLNGHYVWADEAAYTYVPPAPPERLEQIVAAFSRRPLFSIVVPLYNTPEDLLARLVASVTSQWYGNWELVLVDDRSPSPHVRSALDGLVDPRITKLFLTDNCGIAGATNAGIETARGDFIVFLDHDDELTADCLFELAACIERADPDFIYSDEDKLTPDGRFTEPFFKPDWSPDTIMSLMYTCHVSCMRKALVMEVGGLRPAYDGAQDWDLVLRVTEKTRRIAHIPKVLYHWRIVPGSTSGAFDAKPKALIAQNELRLEALRRRGLSGTIEDVGPTRAYSRVRYFVRGNPKVSIVIPSKDNGDVLRQCVRSILEKTTGPAYEIVIMDNGSTAPGTMATLKELTGDERVRVVRDARPFNFSQLCNGGAAAATGDILLFLNDDTEVLSGDWLDRMAGYAQLPHAGAVGAKLLYPRSLRVQHVGVTNLAPGPSHAFLGSARDEPGPFSRAILEYNWMAVTGACLMVSRTKFDAVGGFDETFPVAYNDVELCYRLLKAGFFNVVCTAVELIHHESLTRGLDHANSQKMQRLSREKRRLDVVHPEFYLWDPFFNENLHPSDVRYAVQT